MTKLPWEEQGSYLNSLRNERGRKLIYQCGWATLRECFVLGYFNFKIQFTLVQLWLHGRYGVRQTFGRRWTILIKVHIALVLALIWCELAMIHKVYGIYSTGESSKPLRFPFLHRLVINPLTLSITGRARLWGMYHGFLPICVWFLGPQSSDNEHITLL